jgi:predicted permease
MDMPGASLERLHGAVRGLRIAARSLARAPTFTIVVIATLAVGIGATTSVFSAIYAVLLKPLPYDRPEQLYTVAMRIPERPEIGTLSGRIQDYLEWRRADTAFDGVAALTPEQWSIAGFGEPERVAGARASADLFSVLGVPLELGRAFTRDEEHPGADRVVILSHALWTRRFGASPDVLGKTIDLDGEAHVIVGVAPASMLAPTGRMLDSQLTFGRHVDVWKPIAPTAAELEGESWSYALLLRLRAGASSAVGEQQLAALLNAPEKALPPGIRVAPELVSVRNLYARDLGNRLLLVFAAAALVLLVACTNIASLVLARLATRSTEIATRVALGAGRAAIVVEVLAETLLLAVAGCVAGVLLAFVSARAIAAYGSAADNALLGQTAVHTPVLLFAALMSIAAAVACAVAPAVQFNGADAAMLRGGAGSAQSRGAIKSRQLLLGVEMALVSLLLAISVLLLHSFVNVVGADRGYDVRNVLTVDLALDGNRYPTGAQRVAFYRTLVDDVAGLPGVIATGAISAAPVVRAAGNQTIFLDTDMDFASAVTQRPAAGFREVTTGYFAASGTKLLAGRFFEPQDAVTTAVISESLAKALWPRDAIAGVPGRRIRQGGVSDREAPLLTVLGVARDVLAGDAARALLPQIYRPHLPPRADGEMTLVVKTAVDPEALVAGVREAVRAADPTMPFPEPRTIAQIVMSSVGERSLQTVLASSFALAALFLGAVGVFGVASYNVACRVRDIGLRIAFGATPREILRWALSTGLRPVVMGLSVGLTSAVVLATAMRDVLFRVSPADPAAIFGVPAILLIVAAIACYAPARRAATLDPMAALRSD